MFGDTVSDSLFGFDLTQFLKDPSSEAKSIYNMKAFNDNVFQTAFKESSAKWGEELGKGLGTAIQPAADYVSKLMDAARDPITSQLFTFEQLRTLEAYKSGSISLQDVFDVLTGKAANWETALGNTDLVFEQHRVAFSLNKDKDLNPLNTYFGNYQKTPPQTSGYNEPSAPASFYYYGDYYGDYLKAKETAPKTEDKESVAALIKIENSSFKTAESVGQIPLTVNHAFDYLSQDTKDLSQKFQINTNTLDLSFDKLNLQNQATNSHLNTIAQNTASGKSEAIDTSRDIVQVYTAQQHTNTTLDGIRSNLATYYSGLSNQAIAANNHLTSIQSTATLINTSGLPTVTRVINSGVAGIEATENDGFKTINGSIASHSASIIGSINAGATDIVMQIKEMMEQSCSSGGGGGGISDLFWMGGKGIPGYASGGDFITSGPKIIQVGEAEHERVTHPTFRDTAF
jgi:hypothetical protein